MPACQPRGGFGESSFNGDGLQRGIQFKWHSMLTYGDQKYLIVIRAEGLDEVAEQALHLAYLFVGRALHERRRHGLNGDYEAFAIELLALLQRYRAAYTTAT
jgi:hypothetical protein